LDDVSLLLLHRKDYQLNLDNSGIFDLTAKIKKKIKQFSLLSLCFCVASLGLYPINTASGEKK